MEMMSATWLVTTIGGSLLLVWERSFLGLWVGERYYPGTTAMVLIVVMVLQFALIRNDSIIDLTLNVRRKVLLGLGSAILCVGLSWFLVVRGWGIVGLVLAFIVGRSILTLAYPLIVGRRLDLSPMGQIRGAIPTGVLTCLLSVTAYAGIQVRADSWITLVAGGAATAIVVAPVAAFGGLNARARRRLSARAVRLISSPRSVGCRSNATARDSHFQPGRRGAQRSMVKLAGGIADRGYGIDLVLGHADGHYSSEVHPAVRIVDLGARKMVLSIPSFARYLRHERPRAVLSSLNHVNIVGLWARRLSRVSTRMVVSERNTLHGQARILVAAPPAPASDRTLLSMGRRDRRGVRGCRKTCRRRRDSHPIASRSSRIPSSLRTCGGWPKRRWTIRGCPTASHPSCWPSDAWPHRRTSGP